MSRTALLRPAMNSTKRMTEKSNIVRTFRVIWSEDDQDYVGLCDEYPSLSYLSKDGDKAMGGIGRLVREAEEDLRKEAKEKKLSRRRRDG